MTDKELQDKWLTTNKPTVLQEHDEVFEPADIVVPIPTAEPKDPYQKYTRLNKTLYETRGSDENVRNYGD